MHTKKMRRVEKARSKPDDEEKLISLKNHKRLAAKKKREAREAKTVEISLRILGGVMMAGNLYIWYWKYSVIPMSGLAIIGGIILAGIFKLAYPHGPDSGNKVQKFIALLVTGVIMLLIINRAAFAFGIMLLFSLTAAIYLFGVLKTLPGLKP